jgi:hypothetical protein
MRSSEFQWNYRRFLGWSLIHADCDDVLEDLAAHRKTPVTILARERITNHSTDPSGVAEVIAEIKSLQARHARRLLEGLDAESLAWRTIVVQMEKAFT